MQKIRIISVGKTKQDYYALGIKDYIKRLNGHYNIEHLQVSSADYPLKINDALIAKIKEIEGDNILKRIGPKEFVVLLNLGQRELDSLEFSKFLADLTTPIITFVIGGSYGLGNNIMGRANAQLSLSKMTLIHEMAILFLLEQIYRGVNIQSNTPYHK